LLEVISYLIYSIDGRYLAVGLGSDNGVRVYRTGDYSLVKEDPDYGDSVYGMDFSQYGRLVTTSGVLSFMIKTQINKKNKSTGWRKTPTCKLFSRRFKDCCWIWIW
jgi:WD40 repeat protein